MIASLGRGLAPGILLFFVFLSTAVAQTAPGLPKPPGNQAATPAGPAPEPTLEERTAQLQTRLAEAVDRLKAARTALAADAPAVPGASGEELAEQEQILQRLVRSHQKHLDLIAQLQQLRKSKLDLEAKVQQGPAERPPYGIDFVDGLWGAVLAKIREIESLENQRKLTDSLHAELRSTLEQSQQAYRNAQERLEKLPDGLSMDAVRLRWLRELAELRSRQTQAGLSTVEAERQLLDETLQHHRRALGVLRSQAKSAALASPLSERDRDAKLETIERERNALKKTAATAAAELRASQDAVQLARERLNETRERTPEDRAASDPELKRMATLQARLDARKALAESATLELEAVRLQEEGLALARRVWEQRYTAARAGDPSVYGAAASEVRGHLERIALWREQALSRLNTTYTLIDSQQKRIAGLAADDPERRLAGQVLASYQGRAALFQHLLGRGEELGGLLRRWREEIELHRAALPLEERLAALFGTARETVAGLWGYEIFTAEDTIVVDGEKITGTRSITVSKVVTVLAVLTLGIWLAGRIARAARWLLGRRRLVDAGGGILAYRVVHLSIVLIAVFFALTAFKIPFTVFAFLGGALAIGVGFGAQNLINNFISGLILLIERPVQLGDIVEVEGVRGRVASIGARYSEIRRFDGVDILIPNSALLEKNVTNWTLSDRKIRIAVSVGVDYGSPTDEVAALIVQVARAHPGVLKEPAPVVLFEEFGEAALLFSVYFWVLLQPDSDHRVIASDIRFSLDRLLRERGIGVPYPQRDVHLSASSPLPVQIVAPEAPALRPATSPGARTEASPPC